MANLIQLYAIPLTGSVAAGSNDYTSPCQDIQLNVQNIQEVEAYSASPAQFGINSVINVKYVKANHFQTKTIYSNSTPAQILAKCNAPLA